MHVLLLTAFVSLVLVALFLALFVRERSESRSLSSSEREALLPLDRPRSRSLARENLKSSSEVVAETKLLSLSMRSTGDKVRIEYDDAVVRQFLLATVIWGLVGMTVGVLIAYRLNFWKVNGKFLEVIGFGLIQSEGMEWLTFGRLRPLHTNAAIFFLMLSGRWVQEVAVERNRHRLLTSQPGQGKVRRYGREGGNDEKVELEALEKGDHIGIGPGEVVPVGGELLSEAAELSLEWIRGEPEARVWKRGLPVPPGAVNLGTSEVRVRAAECYLDSAFARLLSFGGPDDGPGIGAVDEGLQRLLKVYLGAILVIGTAGGVAWAIFSRELGSALQVAISVLVVSCPCPLGVAVPLADELAVRTMRSFGLFVRARSLWRKLERIGCVAFDKTGTLTTELPQLVSVEELNRLGERERTVLAELVRGSRHPFSRSLREAIVNGWGDRSAMAGEELAEVVEVVGEGVEGVDFRGVSWKLGRDEKERSGDCVFMRDGEVRARFHFEEALRPDAVAEVADLPGRVDEPPAGGGADAREFAAEPLSRRESIR